MHNTPDLTDYWLQQQKTMLGSKSVSEEQSAVDQNWRAEDQKNVAWSDESLYLLRHTDGKVGIRIVPSA